MLYQNRQIASPEDAAGILREYLEDVDREHFVVLILNTRNEPNSISTVSLGTLNSSLVHPREVFKVALLANGTAVILAHNHPSGDPSPSKEDIDITSKLAEAGGILGIPVLDHIVIGVKGKFVSFKQKGLL